jgi:hypothetical protein
MTEARRFPLPWSVEDIGAAFVVKESTGQKLSYVYFEDGPGRRSAAKFLSGSLGSHRQSCDGRIQICKRGYIGRTRSY